MARINEDGSVENDMPLPKPEGPEGCAVRTGSLPVFHAEGLAKMWEDEATALRMNANRGYHTHATISRVYAKADQLEVCAKELRQWMGLQGNRQPEENNRGDT